MSASSSGLKGGTTMPLPECDPEILRRYGALTVSHIADGCNHLAVGSCMDHVLPLQPSWRFAGRVRTMLWAPRTSVERHDDLKYKLITSCLPGDVIVIATGG